MRAWIKRTFPSAYGLMAEWPVEKWMALPMVALIVYCCLLSVWAAALENAGYYESYVTNASSWDDPE